MKVLGLLLIILAGYFSQLSSPAGPPALSIASPDHPPVWYNRTGDKLTQYLEWSNSKDQLVLHVAYSSNRLRADRYGVKTPSRTTFVKDRIVLTLAWLQ